MRHTRPSGVENYRAAPLDGQQIPRVIVLHTAESDGSGKKYLHGLFQYVDRERLRVHSATAKDGAIGYMMDAQYKGRGAPPNTGKIHIEQAGKAAYSRADWLKRDKQLRATARLTAWYSYRWGIPLTHSTTSGVCQHSDLPEGGHHDCGPGYPFSYVIDLAKAYRKHEFPGTYS